MPRTLDYEEPIADDCSESVPSNGSDKEEESLMKTLEILVEIEKATSKI